MNIYIQIHTSYSPPRSQRGGEIIHLLPLTSLSAPLCAPGSADLQPTAEQSSTAQCLLESKDQLFGCQTRAALLSTTEKQ